MPHVRCAVPITIDAPPEAVLDALARETPTSPSSDGTLCGPFPSVPFEGSTLTAGVVSRAAADGRERTDLILTAESPLRVPFLGWFVSLQARLAARGALRHLGVRVDAAVDG